MGTLAGTPLADLLLARMLSAGEAGLTLAALRKDLRPIAAERWPGAAYDAEVEAALADLALGGWLGRSAKRYLPSDPGKARAREYLGLGATARTPAWTVLKNTFLVARALGLADRSPAGLEPIKRVTGLRAELLRRHMGLPLAEGASLKAASDALGWKLLERGAAAPVLARLPRGSGFKTDNVLAALIYTHLGLDSRPDPKNALSLLAAHAAGSVGRDLGKLREALLRRLLHAPAQPMPAPPAAPPPLASLEDFAARVLASGRASPTGRCGEERVFLSHVWRQLQADAPGLAPGLEDFKQRLLSANRARLLSLACADLAPMNDPRDIEESEVSHLSATYHLLCI